MFLKKKTAFRKLDLLASSGKIKGPNTVGAAIILPEDGNRSPLRNTVFLKKYKTKYKVQKHESFK
jgi:hypothetical protein